MFPRGLACEMTLKLSTQVEYCGSSGEAAPIDLYYISSAIATQFDERAARRRIENRFGKHTALEVLSDDEEAGRIGHNKAEIHDKTRCASTSSVELG